jgi:hypothetical protein
MAAKRGRRSAASLTLVSSIETVPRQKPPAELTREQAAVWNAVVAAEPADWFKASNKPLLAQMCRHVVRARRTAEMIEQLDASVAEAMESASPAERLQIMFSSTEAMDRLQKMQERESRAITSLATKMRLTQQATTNHRGNRIETKKPWDY